jgi:hypothetical protein
MPAVILKLPRVMMRMHAAYFHHRSILIQGSERQMTANFSWALF